MLVGGVDTHRVDLSSMIMLKDNHIWATGSITNAVAAARRTGGFALKIEVECRSEDEAHEAIQAGADIIMLDNFSGEDIGPAATRIKQKWQGQKSFLIEGSGGLTEQNVTSYFAAGTNGCPTRFKLPLMITAKSDIDILSFGSLSQSVPHIDFSLKVVPVKPEQK